MFDIVLTGLSIILFVNAFWLLFMGGYTDRMHSGKTQTFEFASTPYRYSASVGLMFAIALLCLYIAHPNYLALLIAKVPQLKFIFTIAKMKNGTIYLFAGTAVVGTIFAYLLRHTLLSAATFTKGEDLDLDKRAKAAWAEKEAEGELDFERKHGGLKQRFDPEQDKEV